DSGVEHRFRLANRCWTPLSGEFVHAVPARWLGAAASRDRAGRVPAAGGVGGDLTPRQRVADVGLVEAAGEDDAVDRAIRAEQRPAGVARPDAPADGVDVARHGPALVDVRPAHGLLAGDARGVHGERAVLGVADDRRVVTGRGTAADAQRPLGQAGHV